MFKASQGDVSEYLRTLPKKYDTVPPCISMYLGREIPHRTWELKIRHILVWKWAKTPKWLCGRDGESDDQPLNDWIGVAYFHEQTRDTQSRGSMILQTAIGDFFWLMLVRKWKAPKQTLNRP